MDITIIDYSLINCMHVEADKTERKRINFDLRTSSADGSQRMLNALLPGTKVPVHRHRETSETIICLQGCLDVVIFDNHGVESYRLRLSPADGNYGAQLPVGTWHSVEVYEPSTIFEAKDGAFAPALAEDMMRIEI